MTKMLATMNQLLIPVNVHLFWKDLFLSIII